ncbi:MAG TPA: hypothetical protein VGD57_04295 [Candidatus Dormibacteraeota bacterium]|jgi:hypothetical protein
MAKENQIPGDYRHQDTLDERLREERPDNQASLSEEPKGKFDEPESEAVGDTHAGVLDDENDSTAEEAAIHTSDEAEGAVDTDTDSYTGDKI